MLNVEVCLEVRSAQAQELLRVRLIVPLCLAIGRHPHREDRVEGLQVVWRIEQDLNEAERPLGTEGLRSC